MAYSKNILRDNQNFDKYEVLSLLGRGSMGEVYRVRHKELGQEYAIKLLLTEFSALSDQSRFRSEARIMVELGQSSDFIVKVDDFGTADGKYWLRMELAGGFNGAFILADLMRDQNGLPLLVAPELFSQLFRLSGMN